MILSDLERNEIQKYIAIYDFSDDLKNKTILITGSGGGSWIWTY